MLSNNIENYIMQTFELNSSNSYKIEELTDGFSGADVYILEIVNTQRSELRGVYILKVISTLERWYEEKNNELSKSKRIYANAAKYREHLVKVEYDAVIDDKLVLILSYALKSVISSVSMAQLKIDKKLSLLEKISYELLAGLNANAVKFSDDSELIEKWCSYRISDNGNFEKRLKMYICELNRTAIDVNGKILPNPLYYIGKIRDLVQKMHLQFIVGMVHGDLHQKNILTLKNINKYAIIDYDNFGENYLLFDQAYLELNLYEQLLKDCDLDTWMNAMEYAFQISDEEKESVEFAGIIQIESCIRKGIERWYNEEQQNLMDSFHVQMQLARIASGINFFSKNGITNQVEQFKYLIYIAYGFERFFSLINYKWDKNDVSRMIHRTDDYDNVSALWNECGKFRNEYIKILITDDSYEMQDYKSIFNLAEIDWRLIVDVGRKKVPNDLVTEIVLPMKEVNSINFIEDEEQLNIPGEGNTSFLQIKKGELITPFDHWVAFKKIFVPVFKTICNNEPLKSVLFILDFHEGGLVRNRLIEMLWEENLLRRGSRFVCLGNKYSLSLQDADLKEKNIKYFEHEGKNLNDVVRMINDFGLQRKRNTEEIVLPSIESLDGKLTLEEWNDYNSYVEIIYEGIERKQTDYTNGEDFYRGNEINWLDLAQEKDIKWSDYDKWKKVLIKKLQTERVAECRLLHGAGSGGTTLSKRLMWDIKGINPTLRVRKYSPDATNVIIDIYRKTGKSVLVVVEMGSTVVSEEELELMKGKIEAQSCHALFLRVERTISEDEKAEIYIGEELKKRDANKFYTCYLSMTDDEEKKGNLYSITNNYLDDEWKGQRCPFFYGFYTFEEKYQGIDRFLIESVQNCSDEIKKILTDMAIITIYSQNICMPYAELAKRLNVDAINLVEIFTYFNEGIEKIMTQKDKGVRICHPIIAKKILEIIYSNYRLYNEQLFYATIDFIDHMNIIYEEIDREYLDKVFKEIFIDRSYIDGEQQKFAKLINELDKQISKIKIFEKLTRLYKDNPHYYNHLGRLQIFDEENLQFDKAIGNLRKALNIAKENELSLVSHYTTLGCIYSKKAISEIRGEKTIEQLLEIIKVDFDNANECFRSAREIKENSTYAYFPNILMICNVVKRMINIRRTNLSTLLENTTFEKWYNYYAGFAIQLFEQMKRNCGEELSKELESKSEKNILLLKARVEALKAKLVTLRNSGTRIRESNNLGRTVSWLMYEQNGYKWDGMKEDNLCFVEKEVERIIESADYNQNDVIMWFNVYRQMKNFDIDKAKAYILDYMEETYYKNYLLWLLCFLEYEKGILAYKQVEKYLNACKYNNQLMESNIRTTRNIDAYTLEDQGFPIKKVGSLEKENGEYMNLRTFTGRIIDIDGTLKGKIQLDDLDDVVAMFVPSFTVNDKKREFVRADITSRVEFKLLFTYSGYKAWDVNKV